MALIGTKSKSFLRNSNYVEYVELFFDKDGENITQNKTLETLLQRNDNGNLIINKKKILDTCIESGIKHRMIFNTMNLRYKGNEEIKDILKECQNFLDENAVSGIIEFHPADQTLNSDHIHLWINTDSKEFSNAFANFLVNNRYSNKQDVFVREFLTNEIINIDNYARISNTTQNEREQELNNISNNKETLEMFSDLEDIFNKYNTQKQKEIKNVTYNTFSEINQGKNRRGKKETEVFNRISNNRRVSERTLQGVITSLSTANDLSGVSDRNLDTISGESSLLVRTNEGFFIQHDRQTGSGKSKNNMRFEREGHQDVRNRGEGIMGFKNLEKMIDDINKYKDDENKAWQEALAIFNGDNSFDNSLDKISTSSASQTTKKIAQNVQKQRQLLRM